MTEKSLALAGTSIVEEMALEIPPFHKDITCQMACEYFADNPDTLCVAVVDGEHPIGLINRDEFLTLYTGHFAHALLDKKPITYAADPAPLLVDASLEIGMVSSRIVHEKPSALLKGFIITKQERYLGVGTALGLLRHSVIRGQEREAALEAARREAVEANMAKVMFLANMSHELRTPLNAIIGFSEIMSSQMFGPMGNERYLEYARDVHKSGDHLLGLVNDILDTAQIESGNMKLREEESDLHDIIDYCLNQVSLQAKTAQVNLHEKVNFGMPAVMADSRKLKQILLNLLSNAIKFTPAGGSVSLFVRYAGNGDLEISVADTGIGIEKENIPRVLQKFGQVENSMQRNYAGVGLGLPLAKALVELHGGKLWIDSVLGKGTTVAFFLPRSRLMAPMKQARI
ncbi:MAG TPA: ATP-binding protein [Alphaproteobacteria bacterium]|nr:ATP-binding protein [Alphaproteobacteria bacterium]